MRGAGAALALAVLAAILVGCSSADVKPTTFLEEFYSAGEPANGPVGGFLTKAVADAYIPMQGGKGLFDHNLGAGMVIAPGIAVTAGHNDYFVDPAGAIGKSKAYDLFFFRTASGTPEATAKPWVAEEVIAYGSGNDGSVRMARGRVTAVDALANNLQCPDCGVQHAFTFEANGGFRFSGGPVVDATDGKLIGIVFGFTDEKSGGRLMYAYDMARVFQELALVRAAAP
jgi:hypothetical protein